MIPVLAILSLAANLLGPSVAHAEGPVKSIHKKPAKADASGIASIAKRKEDVLTWSQLEEKWYKARGELGKRILRIESKPDSKRTPLERERLLYLQQYDDQWVEKQAKKFKPLGSDGKPTPLASSLYDLYRNELVDLEKILRKDDDLNKAKSTAPAPAPAKATSNAKINKVKELPPGNKPDPYTEPTQAAPPSEFKDSPSDAGVADSK